MELEREGSAHESVADNEVTVDTGDLVSSGVFLIENESNGFVGIDRE